MRSATSRNYWGGFWGGVLGILAFAWFPPLLPLGCFLGVIFGFWYQEIFASALSTFTEGRRWFQWRYPLVVDALIVGAFRIANAVRRAVELAHAGAKLLRRLAVVVGRWLVRAAQQGWASILRFPVWLRAHPMNQAYALRGLAALVFIAASLYWVIPFWKWVGSKGDGWKGPLGFCVMGGFALALSFAAASASDGRPGAFYRTWERYGRGAVRFWLGEITTLIRFQLAGTLIAILVLTALFSVIPGILLIVAFAVSICVGRGIYRVVQRPDHWPCFTVTLLVTTSAAWFTRPYLAGATLWLVALATGCISGAAAEVTRRLLSQFFERWPQVRAFLYTSIETQVGRAFTAVGRRIESVLDRTGERLFAY